jgi:glyoxylase-like metal-dependent hydrolase (beta-lactamase superfamily II)
MLSDILIPFLELEAEHPIEDYLAALQLLEDVAGDATILITGHGSVGGAGEVRTRIEQDRAYVQALHDGGGSDDPRLTTRPNKEWLSSVHEWQVQQLTKNAARG